MEKEAINSDAYAAAKEMLHKDVTIVDAYARRGWLYLQLSSGVRFIVKNKYEKKKDTITEGISLIQSDPVMEVRQREVQTAVL